MSRVSHPVTPCLPGRCGETAEQPGEGAQRGHEVPRGEAQERPGGEGEKAEGDIVTLTCPIKLGIQKNICT